MTDRFIHGKTVYVFGAGASVQVGAPLLKDFLVVAKMLFYKGEIKERKESFSLVFDWIEKLKSASYYVDVDLDNIEHVFSLAEMYSQLGNHDGEQLCDALVDVITLTLDYSINVRAREGVLDFSNSYNTFAQKLIKLNKIRHDHNEDDANNVLVSFNYDPVLDFSFEDVGIDYCLPSESKTGMKLLKLHGSTNWCVCRKCEKGKNELQSVLTNKLTLSQLLDIGGRGLHTGVMPFQVVSRVVQNSRCRYCNEIGALKPFIIPPTWSKRVQNETLRSVWGTIVEELRDAYQIIVVGYSMPQTDTFFQYLLTLGLQSNRILNRVVVVNPDTNPETEDRYRRVFSRSMGSRSRIIYKAWTFEEFLKEGFGTYQNM